MPISAFRITRRRVVIAPLGLAGLTLAGCSSGRSPSNEAGKLIAWPAKDRWPDQLTGAPAEVQEAYRFAIANPDTMKWFPCFCGCGEQGHRSNLDCYLREYRDDGSVVLDPMSFG